MGGLAWRAQPRGARSYAAVVILAGAAALAVSFPLAYPRPVLFLLLLAAAGVTSTWKVNLPISLTSGSTLSTSYAADVTTLLLLGPRHAVVVAVAGAWTQCTFNVKQPYPLYRTAFSMAAETITMLAAGLAYAALGGPPRPIALSLLAEPLVGAIAAYFLVNTGLVAGAIALSTGQRFWHVWRQDFLWSGASFMVAGTAGAVAAVVIDRGEPWTGVLMLAPVYLIYRTYRLFTGRLEDEKRYAAETERLHRQTFEALQQARRAERLKDEFLAMVSHELRTPLNAILGWADMLRSGRLAAERRDRASQVIYESAKRQARLIDELLDTSRIMAGKLRLERTGVAVHTVVASALEAAQPAAEVKQIRIVERLEPGVGPVHGDAHRLQQIVENLLSNAVKFTPEHGVVQVQLRRAGEAAELVVSDTGEGIPRAFLPSVFEPFRQVDGSTTRPHGGLGLGLSIVKHLVEDHGGSVSVDSAGEGRGATFTVRLPLAVARGEPPVPATLARSSPPDGTGPPMESLEGVSVLVVDDDEESRQVIAVQLEARRASVLTAASAAEALDLLQRERVHVLLADVAMPGEDGYTLVRRVRALEDPAIASIPAVAVTAVTRDEDRRLALMAGFQVHVAKPVDAHVLAAAVSSLVRGKTVHSRI